MRIAYIAWGTLILEPDCLLIRGSWERNGPELPVEFARISDDGRVTLVLQPGAKPITTYSVVADQETLELARENLRLREGPKRCKTRARGEWIASVDQVGTSRGRVEEEELRSIRKWVRNKGYDAAVWTAIPPRLSHPKHGSIHSLTVDGIVDYLRLVKPEVREMTRSYFRNVPLEVQTGLRHGIEQAMGW